MKRPILGLPVVLLAAQLAFAQQAPPGPPPRGGGPRVEMMSRQLGLDDAQKAEVKRILEQQRAQHETERKQYEATGQRPTPEEMRATFQQHDQELLDGVTGARGFVMRQRSRRQRSEERRGDRGRAELR